jgi:hypothetical protein
LTHSFDVQPKGSAAVGGFQQAVIVAADGVSETELTPRGAWAFRRKERERSAGIVV